ncbi:MAG: PP2C-family Ser/Thr phosphatase [Gemmatimonadaceae bacterium]|nr:PP2C-family Ser/Thr phosphatase [Gemmatimonadaceae bacterium]
MKSMSVTPAPSIAVPDRRPTDDELDAFGVSHRGKVRERNEDHFLLSSVHKVMRVRATSLPFSDALERPSGRLGLLGMVADGVGGSRGGEEASRAALETIAAYVTNMTQCVYTADPTAADAFVKVLQDAAQRTHESVVARSKENPLLAGMATTLTLCIGVWPMMYFLHVGDSRCYQLYDGSLHQITKDQTLAQELVDSGVLKPEEAARTRLAHVLSSAIGGMSTPVVGFVRLRPGTVTMLCTDGLTKHVSDQQIEHRLKTMTSAEQVCNALLQDALDGGGTDNITIAVARAILKT